MTIFCALFVILGDVLFRNLTTRKPYGLVGRLRTDYPAISSRTQQMFLYSTASRYNNNNPSLVFLEFPNSYIIAMTLITRKRFILETFSYTAVIVQEMTELFTFCDKSIEALKS